MPHFLAIMNTDADVNGYIRKGHETVLRARLTDALFFWDVDRKQSLEERRARLKSIVFQEKLGSYADKVRRMLKLAKKVNSATKARVDADVLTKAAQWSKSDLTTDLVREFTELQGVMGGLYAKYEGAPEDVWRAIYDQYLPQSLDDRSPATPAGAVLSITDKLDTVLSCFSVGLIPTGSEDPLGLRRAMQGVIKVLLDHHLPFSIEKAAGTAATPELKQFYEDRLRFILSQRSFAYDEINAVVNVGCDDASDALDRIEAIRQIRSSPDFEAISLAFKRIKNILRQADKTSEAAAGAEESVATDLEPAEADLFALLNDAKPKIEKLARGGKYLKILETMAASRPVIDHFFDKILVMHENPEVRKRRLALLRSLFAAFSRVADISEIVVQG
jgi:glycyl-tRNA synthetase beta chain